MVYLSHLMQLLYQGSQAFRQSTYVFKIDNGSLVFQADKSASIPKFEKENPIVDGDVFVYKQDN